MLDLSSSASPGSAPLPGALLFSSVQRAALDALIAEAEDGTGCAALIGEDGTGKTAVLDTAAALLGRPPVQVIRVSGGDAPLTSKRLIAQIIGSKADNEAPEAIERALERLLLPASPWTCTILMVDDAHALTRDAFAYLQLMCGLQQAPDANSLRIVFAGRPEFWSLLEPEHLRPLRERIRIRSVLARPVPSLVIETPATASGVPPAARPGAAMPMLPQHDAVCALSVPARRRRPGRRYAVASGFAATVVIGSLGSLSREPPATKLPLITAGYAAPMRAAADARSGSLLRPVATEPVAPASAHVISATPAVTIQLVATALHSGAMGGPPVTIPMATWGYRPIVHATGSPAADAAADPPAGASTPPAPQADATAGPPAATTPEPGGGRRHTCTAGGCDGRPAGRHDARTAGDRRRHIPHRRRMRRPARRPPRCPNRRRSPPAHSHRRRMRRPARRPPRRPNRPPPPLPHRRQMRRPGRRTPPRPDHRRRRRHARTANGCAGRAACRHDARTGRRRHSRTAGGSNGRTAARHHARTIGGCQHTSRTAGGCNGRAACRHDARTGRRRHSRTAGGCGGRAAGRHHARTVGGGRRHPRTAGGRDGRTACRHGAGPVGVRRHASGGWAASQEAGSPPLAVSAAATGNPVPHPAPPSNPPASATAVPQPAAALSPAVVASLLRHGDEMLGIGDIAAARLLFRRAAEAGSAAAAIAIGKTNDPRFLARDRRSGDRARSGRSRGLVPPGGGTRRPRCRPPARRARIECCAVSPKGRT